VEHFHRKYAPAPTSGDIITAEALHLLLAYPFPGNIRELENLVERSLALGDRTLTVASFPPQVQNYRRDLATGARLEIPAAGLDLEAYLAGIERELLLQALERCGGVKKKAAELLAMSFRSFRYRLAKLGLDDDKGGEAEE
jgi:two-component system response regulator PilR (NtrC family)